MFRSTFSLYESFKKWDNWTAICKNTKLEHSLTLSIKTSSKWIKNLNTRPDTIKLLEENVGDNFLNVVLQGFFFFGYDTKSITNKIKHQQVGLHLT